MTHIMFRLVYQAYINDARRWRTVTRRLHYIREQAAYYRHSGERQVLLATEMQRKEKMANDQDGTWTWTGVVKTVKNQGFMRKWWSI